MTKDQQPPTGKPKSQPFSLQPSTLQSSNPPILQPATFLPGLLAALTLYLCLAFSYFFIVPIFEAPDEWTHTGHIKYIAEGNGLPVMLPGQGIPGGQQPPLYYVLGAIIVQPFSLDGFNGFIEDSRNPHASIGYALDPGNKNNYLHTPAESFPYRGLALTVHVLRLYSMVLGAVGLVFIYFTAFELVAGGWRPQGFAAVVTLFVACQPMYAFITASVTNEPANIAFCAGVVWLAQRYILYGTTPRWGRAVALGVMLGLAALSKMTGLAVGLVTVLAFLITAISTRRQRGAAWLLWRDGTLVAVSCLLVAGWWYWRNYGLYGDFFQRGLYKIFFNQEPQPLTLADFLFTLKTGEVSFWATFGWLNIVGPDWIYGFYRLLSRVGIVATVVGMTVLVVRSINRRPKINSQQSEILLPHPLPFEPSSLAALLLHLVFPTTLAFSLARLVALEGGMQGRQILPAVGSLAIVIVWGWWVLSPPPLRSLLLGSILAVMVAFAVWLPFGVVARAYIPAASLTQADLPEDLIVLNRTYRDQMRLIGARIGIEVVRPGERVPVTLYWQALKPMSTNYSVFVHLIGQNDENVGQFNSYPGLGLRPTTTLEPGQIVADTYPVQVNGGAKAPTRLLINVGLFDFNTPGRPGLPALDSTGQVAPPGIGHLKLVPHEWPQVQINQPLATFGDTIWLAHVELKGCTSREQRCIANFTWLPQERPPKDFTVFIQLWQAGQFVQGFDAQPLNGDYPTGLWDAGEVIVDPHRLELSALNSGEYQIKAGLYDLETLIRLPVSLNGQRLPADAIEAGTLSLK